MYSWLPATYLFFVKLESSLCKSFRSSFQSHPLWLTLYIIFFSSHIRFIYVLYIYIEIDILDILDIFLYVSDTYSLDLQDKQNPLIHQRPNRFPEQKQGSAQTGFGCKNMTGLDRGIRGVGCRLYWIKRNGLNNWGWTGRIGKWSIRTNELGKPNI